MLLKPGDKFYTGCTTGELEVILIDAAAVWYRWPNGSEAIMGTKWIAWGRGVKSEFVKVEPSVSIQYQQHMKKKAEAALSD